MAAGCRPPSWPRRAIRRDDGHPGPLERRDHPAGLRRGFWTEAGVRPYAAALNIGRVPKRLQQVVGTLVADHHRRGVGVRGRQTRHDRGVRQTTGPPTPRTLSCASTTASASSPIRQVPTGWYIGMEARWHVVAQGLAADALAGPGLGRDVIAHLRLIHDLACDLEPLGELVRRRPLPQADGADQRRASGSAERRLSVPRARGRARQTTCDGIVPRRTSLPPRRNRRRSS